MLYINRYTYIFLCILTYRWIEKGISLRHGFALTYRNVSTCDTTPSMTYNTCFMYGVKWASGFYVRISISLTMMAHRKKLYIKHTMEIMHDRSFNLCRSAIHIWKCMLPLEGRGRYMYGNTTFLTIYWTTDYTMVIYFWD